MIAMYVSAATALVLAGAAIGILVMVCLGTRSGMPPSRTSPRPSSRPSTPTGCSPSRSPRSSTAPIVDRSAPSNAN